MSLLCKCNFKTIPQHHLPNDFRSCVAFQWEAHPWDQISLLPFTSWMASGKSPQLQSGFLTCKMEAVTPVSEGPLMRWYASKCPACRGEQ